MEKMTNKEKPNQTPTQAKSVERPFQSPQSKNANSKNEKIKSANTPSVLFLFLIIFKSPNKLSWKEWREISETIRNQFKSQEAKIQSFKRNRILNAHLRIGRRNEHHKKMLKNIQTSVRKESIRRQTLQEDLNKFLGELLKSKPTYFQNQNFQKALEIMNEQLQLKISLESNKGNE